MAGTSKKNIGHPVRKHFIYDENKNVNLCSHCNEEKKGNHAANLTRHIESKHKDVYIGLKVEIDVFSEKIESNKNENIVLVPFDLTEVKKACVTLATVDGRPFSLFNDAGMKKLLPPIFNASEKIGRPLTINRWNIKKYCKEEKSRMLNFVREEVKNQMVTSQMDIATVLDR